MKKVAITGGLSCGKSTVCQFLKNLGAYGISSDKIVHQLLSPETNLGKQVIGLLGQKIISNFQIDRQKIAQIVFSNKDLLKALEDMVHPKVKEEITRLYDEICTQNYPLFVVEVPLLFETSFDSFFDVIITVVADEKVAMNRFMANGRSKEDYLERVTKQWPINEKAAKANYIIENNGDLQKLSIDVQKLFKNLTA